MNLFFFKATSQLWFQFSVWDQSEGQMTLRLFMVPGFSFGCVCMCRGVRTARAHTSGSHLTPFSFYFLARQL
jgi:hypothetical protein